MMNQPTGPVPADASQGDAGDESETFTAPLAAIGDVKQGDTVTVQVVSIDEKNGVATLQAASDEPENPGGTDGMADEFQSPQAGPQQQ